MDQNQPEEEFVEDLPEYLRCPICLCCLSNPYQTPCGHRFCKECILPVLKSRNNVCPNDRTTIDLNNTFPDNAVKLQINSLKIRCPMNGCEWVGELLDKADHLSKCKFLLVACELCDKEILKSELAEHVEKECPQRKVTCDHCDIQVAFCSLEDHYTQCPNFPVPCDFKCDTAVTIPRKDLPAHLKTCPRALVPCSMSSYGCQEMVERGLLQQHLQLCIPQHVGSMCQEIQQLKKEVQQLKLSLDSQKDTVKQIEADVYPSAGQFTWRIDNIREKAALAQSGDQAASVMYSPSFYSSEGGYKLSLCVYPAGDNNQGFLSLYFVVMKGKFDEVLLWPFQKRVFLSLLNTKGGQNVIKDIQPDPRLHYFHRPENPRNVGYGFPKFITLTRFLVEDSEFIENGAIFLRCRIFD